MLKREKSEEETRESGEAEGFAEKSK